MSLHQDLRPLTQLIDRLRDCGIDHKISLPRIAVIGTQSSGKSSLLESIVGFNFLPRGSGVVTRTPLELRLVHLKNPEETTYAVFGDEKDAEYPIEEVMDKIEEKTNKVAGHNKGIVDNPIVLTIYSHSCLDLTLVDLPGITRVPLKGSNQAEDIERVTIEMTNKYIKDERTIILCVISANTDITTSDALNLARKADPKGLRTLGVLTKIDIMDKGTSVVPILKNEVIYLKHGYVAVKNRSQEDINSKMDVQEALEMEKAFFEDKHELLGLSDQLGTSNLTSKLAKLLHKQIWTYLPKIEKEIGENLEKYQKFLDKLGQAFPTDNFQKYIYITGKVREIANQAKEKIEGRSSIIDHKQFQGYAHFHLLISKFHKEKSRLFVQGLNQNSVIDIILEIVEYKGLSLPGFLPKEIIEKRIQTELEKLKGPINNLIEAVKEHNRKILKSIFDDMGSNVGGKIKTLLQQKASEYLEILTKKAREITMDLIETEKAMIWTSDTAHFTQEIPSDYSAKIPSVKKEIRDLKDEKKDTTLERALNYIKSELPDFDMTFVRNGIKDFGDGSKSRKEYKYKLEQIKSNDLEVTSIVSEDEIILFYDKLLRYNTVVSRNLSDTVPKIIGKKMIKDFFMDIESYFMKIIPENMEELTKITEDSGIQKRRDDYQGIINNLKEARSVLQSFHLSMGRGEDDEDELENEELAPKDHQTMSNIPIKQDKSLVEVPIDFCDYER